MRKSKRVRRYRDEQWMCEKHFKLSNRLANYVVVSVCFSGQERNDPEIHSSLHLSIGVHRKWHPLLRLLLVLRHLWVFSDPASAANRYRKINSPYPQGKMTITSWVFQIKLTMLKVVHVALEYRHNNSPQSAYELIPP